MAEISTATSASTSPRPGSGAMFDGIAERYDLINRLMSFGLDRAWRRRTVAALALPPAARALDLATGTADVALEIARRHPDAEVIGLDPSMGMLGIGRAKVARELGKASKVRLELGSAEQLPLADESFHGVSIAFGIRNVADRPAALSEIFRVLKPGGRLALLEANEPSGLLAPLVRFYLRQIIPRLGALLSGDREYRYLQTSIASFPEPAVFARQLEENGLCVLTRQTLAFGACTLYVATPYPSAKTGSAS
jgi:demethylmenaquinone methyltransferase/2-methoxy-6-polyprenyl-1,4-benzoquinol methylase